VVDTRGRGLIACARARPPANILLRVVAHPPALSLSKGCSH
jgi:hypothetical protein